MKSSKIYKHLLNIDGFVLFLLPLLSAAIVFLCRINFFESILLFLGLPALYLSVRAPRYAAKTFVFSFISAVPLMIILEYVGGLSFAWGFPPSVFSYHILGRVNLEVVLWAFLNIYSVVIFYEYIFERHHKVPIWNKRMWTLVRYLLIWIILFGLLYSVYGGNIAIPYFYFLFGCAVFIFPVFMTWLKYPRILHKILYVLLYFSYLSFVYEILALKNGWWFFPGSQFIGYITVLGVTFPIEEFIFWIILFAPAVVGAFEYLDDDRR